MSDDSRTTSPIPKHPVDDRERDACALICAVRKGGQATHGNVKRTIEALTRMGHRAGIVDGEGDGVGIMTDIPRQIWARQLMHHGLRASLAIDPNFWVAHLMIPVERRAEANILVEHISHRLAETGLHVLHDEAATVNSYVLGRAALKSEPLFWQFAGVNGSVPAQALERTLFRLQAELERELGVHFPSFSSRSVVYKVQGTVEILRRYYPELRDPEYASTVTLGHARYSTNTNPIFERVQPFNVIGHNGEFNTISRFRLEAAMLGIDLDPKNSDSQDIDRALDALCMDYDLDLIEAMEYIFPPFDHDLVENSPDYAALYQRVRQSFGPFAQGPAAVAARMGDQCVFSVDAMGLRPLWFGETEKEYFATSERGVYPLDTMSTDPKPLAPGEKIALVINPGRPVEVLDYPAIQRHVLQRSRERMSKTGSELPTRGQPYSPAALRLGVTNGNGNGHGTSGGFSINYAAPAMEAAVAIAEAPAAVAEAAVLPWQERVAALNTTTMAALGWERYHLTINEALAESAKELVGSLGWDGPLAAISQTRVNVADFFKETVAVVTNPAIDRERERAQFSTTVLLGSRPTVGGDKPAETVVTLGIPLLVGGHPALGDIEDMRAVARKFGTQTLEDVIQSFGNAAFILPTAAALDETIPQALDRLRQAALDAVRSGVRLLVLDDNDIFDGGALWIDPLLVTSAIDQALRLAPDAPNLRRQVGIVLRSGALRDLHDITLALGMGANALVPYAMYATALEIAPRAPRQPLESGTVQARLSNVVNGMTIGVQKITSTIGCHELRGYGLSFSSVGIAPSLSEVFGTSNYFAAEDIGLTWERLTEESRQRAAEFRGEAAAKMDNPDRIYPKMWKKVEDIAHGELGLDEYTEIMTELERDMPVALRHIIGLKTSDHETDIDPSEVDISIKDHSMPILIGAMSFGSQGELAYKAYAEAAARLDILCINGEGGELPDMLNRYPRNRGQQVASARFGVNIGFLNSCAVIEIKIGQGAKPGEGGQLPGYKVTPQVALARSTNPWVDLISPSNNHDLYSIEDLAQLIEELKTANPRARVSVKIPVVPGVGIIAVGIAKAGADIINITGYEGGTGAARAHSLRHVGLPAEIGVWLAHHALTESGLRDQVELWCDGGMKSGRDVLKMLCLGANRVGFGTMAMVAVGCTICRKCHEGTCHVGITTHVRTLEEAKEKGIKHFEPRDYDMAVLGIRRVFELLGEDIRRWTARLGFTRTQDVVGRADLLEQIAMLDRIDLSALFVPAPPATSFEMIEGVGRRMVRPRNNLTKQITALVIDRVKHGDYEMTYDDESVMAMDRALGTHLCGAFKRGEIPHADEVKVHLNFSNSAVPGNGLGAFLDAPVDILVEGGAQDGAGKCARGGRLHILKGLNHNGQRLDGSVGKSFGYGAQGGKFIVQGYADTRTCIRLSGADVIFGGEITQPLRDHLGGLAARSTLKGYAFEYMTSGRALVLGDPGPWMCAGMSGGVIYQRINTDLGLDVAAIQRRIAKGATVEIMALNERGVDDVRELLGYYIKTLEHNNQADTVAHLYRLLDRPEDHFVMLEPPTKKN